MPRSKEELDQLGQMTTRLAECFKGGRRVHFTTAKGTDLTMEIGKLWVFNNTGIARPGELEVLPPGLAGAGPTEGSANGRLVVNASIAPLYEVLKEPVVLTIEGGRITGMEGGTQAMAWKRMIEGLEDPAAYTIAEVGVGTHPRARLSGEPLEDERIYGSCHIGIGTSITFGGQVKAKWHVDANVLDATLEVDGRRILEGGRILV